jgi:mRNA-degrading endonuclease toxin of MazEF toxin-antitoxin module
MGVRHLIRASDPLTGWVVCDDLQQLVRDELTNRLGALSATTIHRVNAGLRIALAIP